MLFNSLPFFVFFTVFCLGYFSLPKKLKLVFILLASIVFYYLLSPKGIFVLAVSVFFNFCNGVLMEKSKKKGAILTLSFIVNIGMLFVFKYFDFFNTWTTTILHSINISNPVPFLHLIIPAGISYYTLQAIGYNMDVYSEIQKAEKNFTIFATYFFFFPKIAQGPVERPRNLLPQLHGKYEITYVCMTGGLKLLALGMFKKFVIANRLGALVDQIYNHPHEYSGVILLVGGLFYTFQLYADFSGYTDMALGIAQIMGFKLMINFNRPFASSSVTEFWKRWHISFSTWLYEYI
jgi:D-alanyl-lipoteichoic acid acyltransferase DltB (MBOAT superfamily)